MAQTVGEIVHKSRCIYNSNFHDNHLFEMQYVNRLMSVYKVTKPLVSYSDIVKRGSIANAKKCKPQAVTGNVAKMVGGRNSQVYGKHRGVKELNQRDNTHTSVKTHCQDVNMGNMASHHTVKRSEQSRGVHNVVHANRFAVLTEANVCNGVENNSDDSVFVELNDARTSKGVNVETVSQNAHKGKNASYSINKTVLFDEIHAPTPPCYTNKLDYDSNSPCSPSHTTSDVKSEECPRRVDIGDTTNSKLGAVDKYSLEMHSSCKKYRMREARGAKQNKILLAQNKPLFGFIPTYGLQSRVYDTNKNEESTDLLQLHSKLRSDGRYNYRGLQIPVPSKLNFRKWEEYLVDYWDWELPMLIKYGFPLDFHRETVISTEKINHKSALQFPSHVDTYLTEETEHGAMGGPYADPPIQNLHISPFMTRDKSSSDKRRVIMDLSWPKGQSVNSGAELDKYLGTQFVLTYPSVDNITDQVLQLGRGCQIFKVDISRAFRHVPIDPGDLDLLGLHWGQYYIDFSLPFGLKHGSSIFQRLSDAVRYIMKQEGHQIWNYIDDFLCVALPSKIQHSFARLQDLLQELGLTISQKKLVAPSTKVVCLGILVNTEDCSVSIPGEKLTSIKQMCVQWSKKLTCTKKELQSLLGSLLYIAKCIKYARFFLNRMLSLLREHYSESIIELNQEFHKDLKWFNTFLSVYNGVSFFQYPYTKAVHLDACTTGLGAIYENQVYALQLPNSWSQHNIAQLEMINILVALKVWHNQWAGQRVVINCDNQAVVAVLTNGRSRDVVLAKYARNIFMWLSTCNIDMKVVHIAGKKNSIADLLSRWFTVPNNVQKLQQLVHPVTWIHTSQDLLATHDGI